MLLQFQVNETINVGKGQPAHKIKICERFHASSLPIHDKIHV